MNVLLAVSQANRFAFIEADACVTITRIAEAEDLRDGLPIDTPRLNPRERRGQIATRQRLAQPGAICAFRSRKGRSMNW